MCGADPRTADMRHQPAGSPPRVRSRLPHVGARFRQSGITSACAEQTAVAVTGIVVFGDHLRVCGADCSSTLSAVCIAGSPPRVRSRHKHGKTRPTWHRITSACAEQTGRARRRHGRYGDHLRVCGADFGGFIVAEPVVGSPPRVRSRRRHRTNRRRCPRITSACAEQTPDRWNRWCPTGDHLRVCGADIHARPVGLILEGSPPRVRSRHRAPPQANHRNRITSACAEQTLPRMTRRSSVRDHLRVCGADRKRGGHDRRIQGSPPRVRSRPRHQKP